MDAINNTCIGIVFILLISTKAYTQEGYYEYSLSNFRDSPAFNDTIDPEHPKSEVLNAVVFYLTNEIRVNNKLPELVFNDGLEESAQLHSESMVNDDFFDHINPVSKEYRTPNDRARFVGIINPYLAENIVEGFVLKYKANEPVYCTEPGIFRYHPEDDPIGLHTYLSLGESLIDMWMHSPVHKANILSTNALQLGCGSAYFFRKDFYDMPAVLATQNFQFYEAVQIAK